MCVCAPAAAPAAAAAFPQQDNNNTAAMAAEQDEELLDTWEEIDDNPVRARGGQGTSGPGRGPRVPCPSGTALAGTGPGLQWH